MFSIEPVDGLKEKVSKLIKLIPDIDAELVSVIFRCNLQDALKAID